MKLKRNRALAWVLVIVTLIGLLSACSTKPAEDGDKNNDAAGSPLTSGDGKLDYAYLAEPINIDSDTYMRSIIVVDGRIYYIRGTDRPSPSGDGTSTYVTELISVTLDGADERVHYTLSSSFDKTSETSSNESLDNFNVREDGTIIALLETYTFTQSDDEYNYPESSYSLLIIAPDGTEKTTVLSDEVDMRNTYFEKILFDADGNIYLMSYESIIAINGETGEYAFSINNNDSVQSSFRAADGRVMFNAYGPTGMVIKSVDFASKSVREETVYNSSRYFYTCADGTGDYACYFNYNSDIYGLRMDNWNEDLIVSGINSDIDLNDLSAITAIDDGFLIAQYSYSETSSSMSISRLTKNENATVGDKVILTLGVLESYLINAEVTRFNRESSTIRVVVTDYSQYNTSDDYTAGMTRFDADILSGRAPDIISFTGGGLPPAKYAAKGILEDLYPFLDADPQLSREDMLQNILKVGEVNGELSHIVTGFSILTLAGKQSVFGNVTSITPQELAAVVNRYPDARLIDDITADTWIQMSVLLGLDTYIDWTTGKASFDNPDFIAALEFAKRFPKEIDYGARDEEYYMMRQQNMAKDIADNKILLQDAYMSRDIRGIRDSKSLFGEDVAFVGFPAPEGKSGHVLYPDLDFGISATSQHKDEAWEFIRTFLMPDYQVAGDSWRNTISTNRTKFEAAAAEEMKPLSERDLSKGLNIMIQTGSMGWGLTIYSEEEYTEFLEQNMAAEGIDIEAFRRYEMTESEVNQARSLIESASMTISQNEQILKIITEETEAFINGAKTAEDTAKIIQSRVQLYVSESM